VKRLLKSAINFLIVGILCGLFGYVICHIMTLFNPGLETADIIAMVLTTGISCGAVSGYFRWWELGDNHGND